MHAGGIQIGVGESVAVGWMLVGVDEAVRQHGLAPVVEHRRVGSAGPHDFDIGHRADAAVEADMHAVVRPVPLRQQDVGSNDQPWNGFSVGSGQQVTAPVPPAPQV